MTRRLELVLKRQGKAVMLVLLSRAIQTTEFEVNLSQSPRNYNKSRRTRKSVASRLMAPMTRANATMRLQIAVPVPSSRPTKTQSPGKRSPLELWCKTRLCARRNTWAAHSGDDGADTTAEAALRQRCIV